MNKVEVAKEFEVLQEAIIKALGNGVYNKVEIFAIDQSLKRINSMLNELKELKDAKERSENQCTPKNEIRAKQVSTKEKG